MLRCFQVGSILQSRDKPRNWRWRDGGQGCTASPSPGEPLLAAGLLVTKLTQSAGQEHLELGAVSLVSTFLDQNDLPQQTSQRK